MRSTRRVIQLAAHYAIPILLPSVALVWLASKVYPFIEDDTLITLRYAQRLLSGHGLTWTDGEAVEGYSNLLWLLLNAALGALGLDLILAVRLLGAGATLVTLVALVLRRGPERVSGSVAALVSAGYFALSAPVAVWTVAGLEQPLLCALLALALWRCARLLELGSDAQRSQDEWILPVLLALLCITRPDAPLLVAIIVGSVIWVTWARRSFRAAIGVGLKLLALPLLISVAQLTFRVIYYGDYVPNTAYVKTHVNVERLHDGWMYVWGGVQQVWPMAALALLGAVFGLHDRRRRAETLLLLALTVAWIGYVVLIGGDHFPCYRHLLVALVCLASLVGLGVERLFTRGWLVGAIGVATALALSLPFVRLQRSDPGYQVATGVRWQWDGKVVGELFGKAFADAQPLWAVTAAGCLPYFSKLPALDMLGLNDRHIARTPPLPGYGLAHDHGDGRYVLGRQPDLITFGLPEGGPPVTVSGDQMRSDPRFASDYRQVRFEGLEPHRVVSRTYVRISGRVGIETSDARIRYPAYLLEGEVLGQLGLSGTMGARLSANSRAQTQRLALEPGAYRALVLPENPNVRVDVVLEKGRVKATLGAVPTLHVQRKALLRLGCTSPKLETSIEALVIERLSDAESASAEPTITLTKEVQVLRAEREQQGALLKELGRFNANLDGWAPRGSAARWVVPAPSATAATLDGAVGGFVNSFSERRGERAQGTLSSPPFQVPQHAWLALSIGGGDALSSGVQVGVRLHEGKTVRAFFSGDGKDQLQQRRLDLAPYAGRTLHLEIIDLSRYTHTLVDEVSLEGASSAQRAQ